MFHEDLTEFFDDFAVKATLVLANGRRREIQCIYDDPYLNADLGEYVVDTSEPRITARTQDIAGLTFRDSQVIVQGETFDVVTQPQHDGTGISVVKLARQVQQ